MSDHQPLTNPDADGFPELVYAMHKALVDLLGDQFDIDYDALAPELADTAWKQLRPRAEIDVECGQPWVDHTDDDGVQMLCPDESRCTCAATNAVGATSWEYRCAACTDGELPVGRSCSCANRETEVGW